MKIVKCENEKCENGVVIFDDQKEIFLCDVCGAVYK